MKSLIRLIKSFKYASSGILVCIRCERNFRIHIVAALTVFIFSIIYGVDKLQGAVLTLTVFFVMAAEAVNTAIEAAVDLISPEKSGLAKIAKDAAAAAVLLAAVCSVTVAFFVFSDTARLAAAFGCIADFWWAAALYAALSCAFIFIGQKNKGE